MATQERDELSMLIVSAPLSRAPFLAGWQEFKDELRKVTNRQPGWTDVHDKDRTGRETEGWCRIDLKTDGEVAYGELPVSPDLFATNQ